MNPTMMPRSFAMTYFLIAINITVYLALLLKGGPTYENLLAFGAKENGLIAQGDVIRLFLPMFLHAGLLHIGFNMYGLYQVGRYLEILSGSKSLLLVYILSGITGNLCSFAFSQALSVGASGSLFGILLCLYVIERYENKFLRNEEDTPRRTGLGALILINGVLSFVIPNIDWANHLGGALAGTFIGLAIVMKHKVNLRHMRAVRFLGVEKVLPKVKIYEREAFWFFWLVVLNATFASSATRVSFAEKAFGRGVNSARMQEIVRRDDEYMKEFRLLLSSSKSDSNPDVLLPEAARLHVQKHFASAVRIYEVLVAMRNAEVGSDEFQSDATEQILRLSLAAATRNEEPPASLLEMFPHLATAPQGKSEICKKAATLFFALGFFDNSSRLYECSWFLDKSNLELAGKVVESEWLGGSHDDVQHFLSLADAYTSGRIHESDLTSELMLPESKVVPPRRNDIFREPTDDETNHPI